MNKSGDIYESFEDIPPQFRNLMKSYMFPPELNVAKELNLERCIRVMPHHQDTGGFFIAVIRKVSKESDKQSEFSESKMKSEQQGPPGANLSRAMKAPPSKRLKHVYEENPFEFLDSSTQLLNDWSKIKDFFEISDRFPAEQMLTRNKKDENVRNVYFVSKQIRELTINNGDRIKFINMGVPLFSKADIKDPSNIELRISQEVNIKTLLIIFFLF
jgi:tRNA (cytosine34-C5)-methyltransferase